MPLYALQTFSRGWHWGQNLCTLVGALDYIISFAEWLSVAMIALDHGGHATWNLRHVMVGEPPIVFWGGDS